MSKATTKPTATKSKAKPKVKEPSKAELLITSPANEATVSSTPKPSSILAEAPPKLSALDAAAKVLADAKEPMNTKAIVEAMAAQKLWSSPGGKTPAATLYSAILREIDTKKDQSRFRKAAKGLFEASGT